MKERGIEFADPLNDAEIGQIQTKFGFSFPADLREFLQEGVPLGQRFPNWRAIDDDELKNWLNLPKRGIVFDVEFNNFWLSDWGPRPEKREEREAKVCQLIDQAPTLIPIYAHRMMPDRPSTRGNPVFSVHQTDIIIYGKNLEEYLFREFTSRDDELAEASFPTTARDIEFWDIDQFQNVRWGKDGMGVFDNRDGLLP